MTQHHEAIKEAIKKALQSLATGDLPKASTKLFNILGYRSERVLEGQRGNVEDFIGQFPAPKRETESEKSFRNNTTTVHILFQVTDEEIADSGQGDAKQFKEGLNKSYLFLAVQLKEPKEPSYSRTHYTGFTREINKRFPMPAFLLFRTGRGEQSKITLAFIQRRKHKRDKQRHVLGSVSLIRDIDPHRPHRAHLDLLAGLSLAKRLEWMDSHRKPANFDGLLKALLNTLDTQELNKRFYKDLFGWFKRAIEVVKVPTDQARMISKKEHIIRLITRLLFVWFIKEKGLVAEELFIEERVCSLLKSYDLVSGDSYYRAVLQNLFFPTLNTEIGKRRGFSAKKKSTHRDFSRYRYQDEMADPERLLKLFEKTPFINGGLFDCLDSFESTSAGGYRIDCFSDNPGHRNLLSIPNRLFFAANGLVTIFNRYKFTVEENTPIEQDVALDPELLGKVFENLLAAVNPETERCCSSNARQQTGSYYTPRPVVDYMVDEALVESLVSNMHPIHGDTTAPSGIDSNSWRNHLHNLLDYEDVFDDARSLFKDKEIENLVSAIANLTVLDPACGSGAFPMGVLHKLTLALRRLDPDNQRWEKLQKDMAESRAAAAKELDDISATFERYRDSDFGRKLYIIQNSIFGVDIQPIACQIAKLRFFISLAIDQQADKTAANYGIKPLPNLETRFVAANTLLALGKAQGVLTSQPIEALEKDLRQNREHYFHAETRKLKYDYKNKDHSLRNQLARELRDIGMTDSTAAKIATWAPYDQNVSTNWFDAEYMFGVVNGFDVVIGNPPYVKIEYIDDITRQQIRQNFQWLGDLYEHFIFKGYELVRNKGILSYITNDSWISLSQKIRIRDLILKNRMLSLIKAPAQTFTASIYAAVFVLSKETPSTSHAYSRGEFSAEENFQFKNFGNVEYSTVHNMPDRKFLLSSLSSESTLLMRLMSHPKIKDYCRILDTGIHSGNVRSKIFFYEDNGTRFCLLQGKQIQKYFIYWNNPSAKYKFCDIEYKPLPQPGIGRGGRQSPKNEYWSFCGDIENHHQPERLLMRQTEDDLIVAYHNQSQHGLFYTDNTLFTILLKSEFAVDLKYLLALFNSKLLNFLYHSISQEKGRSQPQVKVNTVKELPAVLPNEDEQNTILLIIEKILQAKATNPAADTSALEAEIDQLIYQLYRLTDQEIATVQGSSPSLGGQAP